MTDEAERRIRLYIDEMGNKGMKAQKYWADQLSIKLEQLQVSAIAQFKQGSLTATDISTLHRASNEQGRSITNLLQDKQLVGQDWAKHLDGQIVHTSNQILLTSNQILDKLQHTSNAILNQLQNSDGCHRAPVGILELVQDGV